MSQSDELPADAHQTVRLTITCTKGDLFRIDRSSEGLSRSGLVMLGVHQLLHEREMRTGRRGEPEPLLKAAARAAKLAHVTEETFIELSRSAWRQSR